MEGRGAAWSSPSGRRSRGRRGTRRPASQRRPPRPGGRRIVGRRGRGRRCWTWCGRGESEQRRREAGRRAAGGRGLRTARREKEDANASLAGRGARRLRRPSAGPAGPAHPGGLARIAARGCGTRSALQHRPRPGQRRAGQGTRSQAGRPHGPRASGGGRRPPTAATYRRAPSCRSSCQAAQRLPWRDSPSQGLAGPP